MLLFFALQLMSLRCFYTETKLSVTIENIRHPTGQIRVGLYTACQNFPTGCKPVASQIVDASRGSTNVSFIVKPGDYAVALFHDVNENGKLDKKLFGIPNEPYGFSNNYHPRVSGPVFADCRVRVQAAEKTISIKLI